MLLMNLTNSQPAAEESSICGWRGVFEQHVENSSGHGCPAIYEVGQSENFLEARNSTLGNFERCCENMPRQDPQT